MPDTEVVRRLLAKVIGDQEFDGKQALLAQVPHVELAGGAVTQLYLDVNRSVAVPSTMTGSRVPGRAWAHDERDAPLGTLVVWVDGGYLSALEFGWVTDRTPDHLPASSQIRSQP